MTVKEKLKELFENNKGEYLSGERIAGEIGCTRGAVWKAVRSLTDEGYMIKAVTNKGYCLDEENDVITESGIRSFLKGNDIKKLVVLKTVDSTNLYLKKLASEGVEEGTLVVSGEQTAGRGRLGRSFFSPSDSGIYMSLLLKPTMGAEDAIRITTAAAVAVSETIEKETGNETQIKWVNDVYVKGKKVCGILTEASFNVEFGCFDHVILGIGINVYEPEGGFPEEIRDRAGALLSARTSDFRNRLTAGIAGSFMKYYHDIGNRSYFEGYENRLMWKNENINIISPSGSRSAILRGIDSECRLMVEYPSGETGIVSSGEISIRRQ